MPRVTASTADSRVAAAGYVACSRQARARADAAASLVRLRLRMVWWGAPRARVGRAGDVGRGRRAQNKE